MRYVFLHYHLFKNAGTTLDSALENQFGDSFATVHDYGSDAIVTHDMMYKFLGENKNVIAISSHHLHGQDYIPDVSCPIRFIKFVFIRNPIDRIRSIYNFYKKNPDNSPISLLASSVSAVKFVEGLLEDHPQMIDNNQVSILANRGFYARPVSEADLEVAWKKISSFSVCAPTERYDDAMLAAEHFISPNFYPHRLNFASAHQNIMEGGLNMQQFKEQIGELYGILVGINRFDRQLHEMSLAELERRLLLIPALETKRASFKERCHAF
jgi:hypothetical protein